MKFIIYILALLMFIVLANLQHKEKIVPLAPSYFIKKSSAGTLNEDEIEVYYNRGFRNIVSVICLLIGLPVVLYSPIRTIYGYNGDRNSIASTVVVLLVIIIMNLLRRVVVRYFNRTKLR